MPEHRGGAHDYQSLNALSNSRIYYISSTFDRDFCRLRAAATIRKVKYISRPSDYFADLIEIAQIRQHAIVWVARQVGSSSM